jgi:antitoxin MazE
MTRRSWQKIKYVNILNRVARLMQRLDLKRGQQLDVTELAGGGFQALSYDADFKKTMEIADEIMDEYRDTLATLAK